MNVKRPLRDFRASVDRHAENGKEALGVVADHLASIAVALAVVAALLLGLLLTHLKG